MERGFLCVVLNAQYDTLGLLVKGGCPDKEVILRHENAIVVIAIF